MNTDMSSGTRRAVAWILLAGLGLSLVLAGIVSFYASPDPDGLESVAQRTGFADTAQESGTAGSPFSDYGVAGVEDERLSVGLAGLTGVAITFLVASGLFLLLAARRRSDRTSAGTSPGGAVDDRAGHG